MIKINHLSKNFGNNGPLKDIDAVINDGDIISIIGSSGCGKSTLLRCISMLEHPTTGQVLIDGVDITDKDNYNNPVRLKMGMVFQSFNLFPNMTVIENIMKPQISILKRTKQEAYDRAIKYLNLVGMKGKGMKYPEVLSGGQKQRVAIARTLAMDPEIILLDEPTSALDPTMVEEVQNVIRDLSKLGKTLLIVTHEMKFAREICNRVFFLDQGIIYDDGTPEEIFDHPVKDRTRRFVNRIKAFEYLVDENECDLEDFISQLNNYAYKNQIDHKVIHKLENCFEELCLEILLPLIKNPLILFVCELNEEENAMNISISYNGDVFNPMDSDNELSLALLKGTIKNEKHSKAEEGNYTNVFEFEVKL